MYALGVFKKNKDKKKSTPLPQADYTLEDFKSFYKLAENITVSLTGKYRFNIITEDIKAIQEFIKHSDRYELFDVRIFASKDAVEYILANNVGVTTLETKKNFDVFKSIIEAYGILIEKKAMLTLYRSIDHDYQSMEDAIMTIEMEFGKSEMICEKELSQLFILNKVTYPRTVLIDYLTLSRYRKSNLKKCIQDVGNDVALWAMVKNIKDLFEKKVKYLRTGKGDWLIKELNTKNVNLMYRILYLERGYLEDITLLLDLYERGMSVHDIIQ